MKFATWEAIVRRQFWFRNVLRDRMAPWTEDAVSACADMQTLQGLVKLAERVQRHEVRIDRHMARGLAALPVQNARH